MRNHSVNRATRLTICALGAFAALVPTASADTANPLWTCRASAAYVELDPLVGSGRVEPIQANGFPDRLSPDRAQCAKADQGVPNITIPDGPANPGLQVTLQAPFARTDIMPEIGAARDQRATATGGVTDPLTITLAGLDISARGVTSQALAQCVGGVPQLTGSSTVAELTVNNTVIDIPTGQGEVVIADLQPLVRIVLNEKVIEGTATSDDQALTQRAVHIQLLQVAGGQPVANVVLGESKVDRHGPTCAPKPPPPTCAADSVAQAGSDPLVCVLTVKAPCPAGSTADASAGGACVITRLAAPVACPNGSVRDPRTNNCILVVQRPCPAGSTPDAQTRVCVVTRVVNSGSGDGNGINGSNGGIGRVNGPRVTCGRLSMSFVRNKKASITSRFGTRLVTRGRLVTCGANPRPIVGARIDVVHVIAGGRRRLVKTGLRSRPGGRTTLILPLNLRSRRIEYAYRPDLTSRRVTSRRVLRLTVRDRAGRILR